MRDLPSEIARELDKLAVKHGAMPVDPYDAYRQACYEMASAINAAIADGYINRIAQLEDALIQALDDMREDYSVCKTTKALMRVALGPGGDVDEFCSFDHAQRVLLESGRRSKGGKQPDMLEGCA